MAEETEYASCFPVGGRVRIGIPLATGGIFQEWGVVVSLERDLLGLVLSRETLPENAELRLGRTLLLRVAGQPPDQPEELCCRALLVGDTAGAPLALRLVEGVTRFEPREYFRQDVYLPVDYRIPLDQDPETVRLSWLKGRRDLEFAAQQPEPGEPAELTLLREGIRAGLEQRSLLPPSAANLSGGGIRIDLQEQLTPGTLVELTFYLPHPRKVLELVGEVVHVEPGPDAYRTALRYRFIEETDRDRIVGYLSSEQLAQLAKSRHGGTLLGSTRPHSYSKLRVLTGLVLLVTLIAYLSHSIVAKRERGEKHEIERIFEEGVAKFIKQRQ